MALIGESLRGRRVLVTQSREFMGPALCAAFTMGWNAVYFAAIRKFAPEGRSGTAAGGTQIFTMVGSGVGPMIFAGILSSSGSYATGFMVTAVFSLVMGARLLWRDHTMRKAAA